MDDLKNKIEAVVSDLPIKTVLFLCMLKDGLHEEVLL